MALPVPTPGQSFVLLDDARVAGARDARLYLSPLATIIARTADEVLPALERIADLARAGHYMAGYIAYEAGQHILATLPARDAPIITLMERSPLMYDAYAKYLDNISEDHNKYIELFKFFKISPEDMDEHMSYSATKWELTDALVNHIVLLTHSQDKMPQRLRPLIEKYHMSFSHATLRKYLTPWHRITRVKKKRNESP